MEKKKKRKRTNKIKGMEIKGWKWKRKFGNIEAILLWSITLCYYELPVFTATPKTLSIEPDRSIDRSSPIRINRSFVKPFKKEYTTMYTDIKRKGTISILRLCFIKERREKKSNRNRVYLFWFILVTHHSSTILVIII